MDGTNRRESLPVGILMVEREWQPYCFIFQETGPRPAPEMAVA